MALLPGSLTLNTAGSSAGSTDTDQRGLARAGKPLLDIGAFGLLPTRLRLFAVDTGLGSGATVKAYNDDRTSRFTLTPYPGFSDGVQVAIGDVFGDGRDDLVTVAEQGDSPEVRIFDGKSPVVVGAGLGVPNHADFNAYDVLFTRGITVAVGDTVRCGRAPVRPGAADAAARLRGLRPRLCGWHLPRLTPGRPGS